MTYSMFGTLNGGSITIDSTIRSGAATCFPAPGGPQRAAVDAARPVSRDVVGIGTRPRGRSRGGGPWCSADILRYLLTVFHPAPTLLLGASFAASWRPADAAIVCLPLWPGRPGGALRSAQRAARRRGPSWRWHSSRRGAPAETSLTTRARCGTGDRLAARAALERCPPSVLASAGWDTKRELPADRAQRVAACAVQRTLDFPWGRTRPRPMPSLPTGSPSGNGRGTWNSWPGTTSRLGVSSLDATPRSGPRRGQPGSSRSAHLLGDEKQVGGARGGSRAMTKED
jgi:hypothetical protein